MTSRAGAFSPPSGMMRCAWRRLGATWSWCIGRTVRRYCASIEAMSRPRSSMSRRIAPQQPNVVVGVDEETKVERVAQIGDGEDEDALDDDDRARRDGPSLGAPGVRGEVVLRARPRARAFERAADPERARVVERVGLVEVDERAFRLGQRWLRSR